MSNEEILETKAQRKKREKLEAKIKAHEEYVKNVINYNRVAAIELANRAKEKKPHKGAYVSIQKVNKIYDNLVQAVYDFDLDIKKNEFIVFVGPSGCGKSTTLRMIAGLEEITAGNLFIDEKYANSLPPKDRNIAMVFQSYALYPHMSVYDNMAFALKLRPYDIPLFDENHNPVMGIDEKKVASINKQIADLEKQINNVLSYGYKEGTTEKEVIGVLLNQKAQLEKQLEEAQTTPVQLCEHRKYTKEEIDKFVLEAASILQLEEYLGRKPKALSGGQRQRVALGRAIVKQAKLFLMDEPLSNLDAKLRVSMRSEIKRLHKTIGATSIYVTHDQTEAMTMADRIVVMDKGVVQQIGSPKEIYDHPANVFVATFIGSPAMNIVETTLNKGVIDFKEAGSLKLSKEHFKLYEDSIKQKVLEIDNFVETGLEKEYEKELLVKRETIVLQLKNKKYKPVKGVTGDPLDNLTLDEEEKEMCLQLFEKEKEAKLALKAQYLEMLETGIYKIKFGVRPEDVFVVDGNIPKEANPSNELSSLVKITELLGNEYFVHVDILGKDFIFKTGTTASVNEGSEVKVVLDTNKIHIFDVLDSKVIF